MVRQRPGWWERQNWVIRLIVQVRCASWQSRECCLWKAEGPERAGTFSFPESQVPAEALMRTPSYFS